MSPETKILKWTYHISYTGCPMILMQGYLKILLKQVSNAAPIDALLREVKEALNAKLYHAAIILVLTLPDICAALETEHGRGGPRQYKDWYNSNLKDLLGGMTAEDCYSLRCGVVHQSQSSLAGSIYKRVLFVPPEAHVDVHCCIMNDALVFSVAKFCHDILDRVQLWYFRSKNKDNVRKNIANLVCLRPQGYAPYIVGSSVIG